MLKRIKHRELRTLLILVTIFNTFRVNGKENSTFYEDSSEESSETKSSEPASTTVGQLRNSSPVTDKSTNVLDFDLAITSGIAPDSSELNQNSTSNSEVNSSPGCPEPFKQRPWVLYGSPPRCYLAGYKWPCPKNMILRPQSNSFYGYCDCHCTTYSSDYFGGSTSSPKSYCLGKTEDGQVRVLSYSKTDGLCHPIFEQGECAEGEWFVFGDNPLLGSFCEKRRCPIVAGSNKDSTFSFYDYKSKACRIAGDVCQSSNKDGVEPTHRFTSRFEDWSPVCLPTFGSGGGSVANVAHQGCPTGEVLSRILKVCVPRRIHKSQHIAIG